jgi:poly-gamma-glutamate synthesis protein (capsule biosynthesis protein)
MNEITLLAVGDIFLQTIDDKDPFERVREILKDKDLLFGNLETPLSNRGKEKEKAVSLHTSPDKVRYLREAGFDALNIANNHIMDLGLQGFAKTLTVLNRNNLTFIGAGNERFSQSQVTVERKGVTVGFLGYSESGFRNSAKGIFINRINEDEIIRDIRSLIPQCHAIVVSLHWGIEKVFYPSPQQVKLARRLIDSGATVILGHHPHVVQGIEQYKSGLIAYSLGNFQFRFVREECLDERTKRTNESIILSLEMDTNGLVDYDIIPVKIGMDFVPYLPPKREQEEILRFLRQVSNSLNSTNFHESWWFEEIAEEYLSGNMKSWIIRIKKYGIKHLIQCMRWLISPFVIRCYIGMLMRRMKKYDKRLLKRHS